MSADVYTSTSRNVLAVPLYLAAQPLGPLLAGLGLEAALARGTRRFSLFPRFGWHQGATNELRQAFPRFTAILLLRAVIPRDDENRIVIRKSPACERAQARFHRVSKYDSTGQVEA